MAVRLLACFCRSIYGREAGRDCIGIWQHGIGALGFFFDRDTWRMIEKLHFYYLGFGATKPSPTHELIRILHRQKHSVHILGVIKSQDICDCILQTCHFCRSDSAW